MSKITVFEHPLIKHKISMLRDEKTGTQEFRNLIEEIATLMPEVCQFEPVGALDGKEDGLFFYRKMIAESSKYLNPNGVILFEIGYDQGQDVSLMLKEAGYQDVQIVKDLAQNDRVVIGRL